MAQEEEVLLQEAQQASQQIQQAWDFRRGSSLRVGHL